ncbi:unnamed protein product [Acanthosepion pharaonis]|uniref:Uncharacterized protein n=1 Tax=Acanthosepion pharaonis TaxID=158019 RepID=A0A812DSS1_ACAPH|nr:unnamed protein product [Sepia pharaonis]
MSLPFLASSHSLLFPLSLYSSTSLFSSPFFSSSLLSSPLSFSAPPLSSSTILSSSLCLLFPSLSPLPTSLSFSHLSLSLLFPTLSPLPTSLLLTSLFYSPLSPFLLSFYDVTYFLFHSLSSFANIYVTSTLHSFDIYSVNKLISKDILREYRFYISLFASNFISFVFFHFCLSFLSYSYPHSLLPFLFYICNLLLDFTILMTTYFHFQCSYLTFTFNVHSLSMIAYFHFHYSYGILFSL